MKNSTTMAIAAAGLLTLGLSGSALAFHDGGVAHCDGCHSMHNSADNPIGAGTGAGQIQAATANNKLLKGSDDSSTCLNCHFGAGGYHVMSTDGSNVGQGGDFYWINKDYVYDTGHSTPTSHKENHGHSIVAADYGLAADPDPDNAMAPGGTYPATNLACTSCHNPHGNGTTTSGGAPISGSGSYGAPAPTDGSTLGHYRLLGGTEYTPPGGTQFTNAAPVARATNVSGSSYGAIVDYGSGMSEWCSNCHGSFTGSTTKHPAGNGEKLTAAFITNYNNYLATGNYGNITVANSFDALVPFERATSDSTTLSTDPVAGVDINSNVMCLTCHRAHASANDNAGRWDFKSEYLAESGALVSADVNLTTAAVYYKAGTNGMTKNDIVGEYGEWQRSLCNKCHGWD